MIVIWSVRLTNSPLDVEHEIQRLMLERLGIEWTPGEPFYALVEDEINRQRAALKVHHDLGLWSEGHTVCPECGQAC